jgi:hypothetical protein
MTHRRCEGWGNIHTVVIFARHRLATCGFSCVKNGGQLTKDPDEKAGLNG